MEKKFLFSIWTVLLLIFTGCGDNTENETEGLIENPYKKTEIVMGTAVTLRIYDEGKEELLETAFDQMQQFSDITAVNVEGSEVDQINDNAGIKPVKVSDEIYTLVKEGMNYAADTDGFFDISIGPLTSLWHIGYDDARKPEQWEIDEVLPLIDYKKIELNDDEQTVFLAEEGMSIDLGGIAKGYFADLTAELLTENGVTTAIIDLGGNLYVMGNNPTGREWSVGIQDPFSTRGETVGKLYTSDKSIVTSGIYERVLRVDGEEYHHLLNPKDGYPFMNGLAGVSIISETSIDGDALSTSTFALGLEGGMEFIEGRDDVEAIFVTRDNKVYTSSGLVDDFELTNENFELDQLPAS